MARAGRVSGNPGVVFELTNADVAGNIAFQHVRGDPAWIMGTTDTTQPTDQEIQNGRVLRQLEGAPLGTTLEDIFPGAGYVRLWAYSAGGCTFTVHHA